MKKIFEIIDNLLNPCWSIINLLIYLIIVPMIAIGIVFIDICVLNFLSITYVTLENLNEEVIKNIIIFIVGNVIFIIIINEIFSKIIKKFQTCLECEILYNFVYELMDNAFKCLSFIAALVQIQNLKDTSIGIESKVYVIFFFSLIIGVQQFIFKSWFKTLRNLGKMNLTQTLYEIYKFYKIKKKLKKILKYMPKQISKENRKKAEKQLKKLFEILYSEVSQKIFKNLGKEDILNFLENSTLKEYKYFLDRKNTSNSKDICLVVKEMEKLNSILK